MHKKYQIISLIDVSTENTAIYKYNLNNIAG